MMLNTKSYGITLLMKQYRDIASNCRHVHSVELVNGNVFDWIITFRGPKHTLYEGGSFTASLKFPEDFPEHPPVMTFKNDMWHPNIFPNGKVCISLLHPADDKDADPDEKPSERSDNQWRPCITAEQILDAVIAMLGAPNPNSPANMEADLHYKSDLMAYEEKVKHLARRSTQTF